MIRFQTLFTAIVAIPLLCFGLCFGTSEAETRTMKLKLRSIGRDRTVLQRPIRIVTDEEWDAAKTAVIVCDVWDYHHCLNAVRRLEEFAPRLDQVLQAARKRGAVVIHAPSDCMPAYVDHPARQRARQVPKSKTLPPDIEFWCSRLPSEEGRQYPIDQSDGGEDDDPKEHAEWAAKLKALGRNPGMPWKQQSGLITIDAERDYISDRGDEVWNILERHGIQNVILTGVHCNMCVVGRPFGLRQMVRNGKHVVLLRDMTDSMYSPKSWPYVDHFTGHDLVLDHVEACICPTITSDQLLGGQPFKWKGDDRAHSVVEKLVPLQTEVNLTKYWNPAHDSTELQDALKHTPGSVWYRGALRVPGKWPVEGTFSLGLPIKGKFQVWLNGHELQSIPPSPQMGEQVRFAVPAEHVAVNDYNLLVVKNARPGEQPLNIRHMHLIVGNRYWNIDRGWQMRVGEDDRFLNIPLPAKFGIGPDAVLRLGDDQRNAF